MTEDCHKSDLMFLNLGKNKVKAFKNNEIIADLRELTVHRSIIVK